MPDMNVPLRVLMIEDSEDDALLIARELKRSGFELHHERVDTAEAVRSALDRQDWDIIISDFSMPHFRGTEALKMLRERDQDTPFIFVSGTIGEETAVEAMRSGAQDYVIKNNLARLVPAIERELRESTVRRERRAGEARFRRVVDSTLIGILFWDPEGRITDANDQFLKLVGYTREDLQSGRIDLRVMTPPEYEASDAEALQEVAATGTCTPFEKEYIRKDGSRVPVIVGGARLDEPDHPGVGFVLDITDRKRVADALRASEERYRLLFERHPHPLWLYDRETLRFLEVNEAAVRHYGYSREEFLGMTIEGIRSPSDVPILHDYMRRAGTGLQTAGVWRHQKRDGTVIDVEVTSHDVDVLDRPTRLVTAVDVTERRRAEEALRVREREQAAVAKLGERAIESSDITELFQAAVSLVSETLDVPYCMLLETSLDKKSLLLRAGVGWREGCVGHARVATGTESQAGYTLQRNEPVLVEELRSETRFRGADLLHDHGVVSGVTIAIPSKDRAFGVLGAHTDRPRSFTQDDIHFLQAVAHIVGTAIDRDRAETMSRQSQRMESVGRLAGGVAHDFNNLLTAIIGYSELLLTDLKPGDAIRADIEEIHKAGGRAASLTRQLLAFSRRQVLESKPLDLNVIIEDMEKMLRRLIAEDIELRVVLQPNLGTVKADPGQIEQVIVNLVVNARDAMPGGGKLTLETANVELDETYPEQHVAVRPGRYVMVAVNDTGVGMDKETRARIFEPFFTTKGPEHGTGLGLATVYGIVKQSGGYIWVYSEPDHGTTFKIYLPFVAEEARGESPGRVSESLHGSETVLLAEDDGIVRRLAERILRQAGYEVLVAQDGAEALLLSERHRGPIHLLISDVVMPQMNGGELFGHLATSRPETRVLYLSGYTAPSIVQQGLLDGRAEFLQKPFTTEALARKVREVLER